MRQMTLRMEKVVLGGGVHIEYIYIYPEQGNQIQRDVVTATQPGTSDTVVAWSTLKSDQQQRPLLGDRCQSCVVGPLIL